MNKTSLRFTLADYSNYGNCDDMNTKVIVHTMNGCKDAKTAKRIRVKRWMMVKIELGKLSILFAS